MHEALVEIDALLFTTLMESAPKHSLMKKPDSLRGSTLVEDLVEAVLIHPDRLVAQVSGAPPLLVTLAEVGLRHSGTRTSVSEGGLEPPRPCGH